MWNSGARILIAIGLCLTICFSWGCMGSSAYRLWYRNQWLEDEQFRPSLHARVEELTELRKQAAGMSEAEQAQAAAKLAQALAEDPSPLYRAEVARTLGVLAVPAATEALRQAVRDEEPSVRIAVCAAWGKRGSEEAVPVLADVVSTDADLDVRTAATRELSNHRTPAAVATLGQALEDPDPALQHRAMLSLQAVTGKDFGNSVPAWRQFVREGQAQPVETPSVAERLRSLF
ncbi:MAG: HEAT repeat domain-containing protein [Candidatus Anammoximicrobium sp.]|nr:HEAT repeat domain-containing protein [Candidatus Anammoximicrobium sp.]